MSIDSHLSFYPRLLRKRILNSFLTLLYPILFPYVKIKFNINDILVDGLENIPKKGSALVLSKHRYESDILLEIDFLRRAGRYGNYIMKASLPEVCVYLGGIKVVRYIEMREMRKKGMSKDEVRAIEEIKNKRAMEYIKWLYMQGEIVVSNPERTIYDTDMGSIRRDKVITTTIEAQRTLTEIIKIIPVGTQYYGNPNETPVGTRVEIGKPITIFDFTDNGRFNEEGLVKKINEEITRLSRF